MSSGGTTGWRLAPDWRIEVADADHERAANERRREYAEAQIALAASKQLLVGSELEGLAVLQPAPFDSECLQMKMAKLAWLVASEEQRSASIERALRRAREAGIEHVTARFRADNLAMARAAIDAGFYLADVSVTFRRAIPPPTKTAASGISIVPYSGDSHQRDAMLALASDIFSNSRYYGDPVFERTHVDTLHRRWVENSCGGRADRIFVATSGAKVLGFVACLFSPGNPAYGIAPMATVDLIGVTPDAQGRGVGTALMAAATENYRGRSAEIQVGTQAYNYGAIRLYTRCGFHLAKAETTLHWCSRRERS